MARPGPPSPGRSGGARTAAHRGSAGGDRARGGQRGDAAGPARGSPAGLSNAVHWDVETQRLDVARALAANTRAMVNVGPGSDVAASLLMHTLPENGASASQPASDATEDAKGTGGEPDGRAATPRRRTPASS